MTPDAPDAPALVVIPLTPLNDRNHFVIDLNKIGHAVFSGLIFGIVLSARTEAFLGGENTVEALLNTGNN